MARIPTQHLLKQFVDRVRELGEFTKMIKGSGKRVICIQAPGAMGKSLLLRRMMQECDALGVCWVYLEWEDSRKYDYLAIIRKIRDEIKQNELFDLFNDLVNSCTKPEYKLQIQLKGGGFENVRVLEGGEIQQSTVTVRVGHQVVINDLNLIAPGPEAMSQIDFRLTEAFMPCLEAAVSKSPLVVFMDALEKADTPTRTWILKEFLTRVRDQQLNNLFVVLAGREKFELDPSFFECSVEWPLGPLGRVDIQLYMIQRGFEHPGEREVSLVLLGAEGGIPGKVGKLVDALKRYSEQSEIHA